MISRKAKKFLHDVIFNNCLYFEEIQLDDYVIKTAEWPDGIFGQKPKEDLPRDLKLPPVHPNHWTTPYLRARGVDLKLPKLEGQASCYVYTIDKNIYSATKRVFDVYNEFSDNFINIFKVFFSKDIQVLKKEALAHWDALLELYDNLPHLSMRDLSDQIEINKSIPSGFRFGYLKYYINKEPHPLGRGNSPGSIRIHGGTLPGTLPTGGRPILLTEKHLMDIRHSYSCASNILSTIREVFSEFLLRRVPRSLLNG